MASSVTASSQPTTTSAAVPVEAQRLRRRPSLGRLLGPVLLLIAWWVASATGTLSPNTLAGPGAVVSAGADLLADGSLLENLLASLQRAAAGLALGVLVGTTLAVLSGLFRLGENLIDAPMQMLRAMPILALVPLAIIWLGIGEEIKIVLVMLGTMFPIYLNTHAGIRNVDPRFVDLGTTVGLGRIAMIRRVILPGALPHFFTGLRFAVAIAWLVLVVSEQVNASSGIGYLMTRAREFSQTDVIVVGLIVYGLLGLLSDLLVRVVERKALTWRSTLNAR